MAHAYMELRTDLQRFADYMFRKYVLTFRLNVNIIINYMLFPPKLQGNSASVNPLPTAHEGTVNDFALTFAIISSAL